GGEGGVDAVGRGVAVGVHRDADQLLGELAVLVERAQGVDEVGVGEVDPVDGGGGGRAGRRAAARGGDDGEDDEDDDEVPKAGHEECRLRATRRRHQLRPADRRRQASPSGDDPPSSGVTTVRRNRTSASTRSVPPLMPTCTCGPSSLYTEVGKSRLRRSCWL